MQDKQESMNGIRLEASERGQGHLPNLRDSMN